MADVKERTVNEGFRIIRQGRGSYLCWSQSHTSTVYAVDLEAHEGLGHCECDDFNYRRYPQWKRVRAKYDFLRCKHLRAVRNHVMDQIIEWMSKKNVSP